MGLWSQCVQRPFRFYFVVARTRVRSSKGRVHHLAAAHADGPAEQVRAFPPSFAQLVSFLLFRPYSALLGPSFALFPPFFRPAALPAAGGPIFSRRQGKPLNPA